MKRLILITVWILALATVAPAQADYLRARGDTNGDRDLSLEPKTNVLEVGSGTVNRSYSNNYSGVATNILWGANGLRAIVLASDANGATASPARYYCVWVLTP